MRFENKYLFFGLETHFFTMKKDKLTLEYAFKNVSMSILWNYISTPSGLETWFSDKVTVRGTIYTFTWDKNAQEAELLAIRNMSHIRFRWLEDEPENLYFEFKIHFNELTSDTILEIVEYNYIDEHEDSHTLWDTHINILKRKLGVM